MKTPHQNIKARGAREKFLVRLLDSLWLRYRARMAHVRRYEALVGDFLNDHIAFRTFAASQPAAGIFSTSRLFEALGYVAAACYEFPDKDLSSIHYQHPNPEFPKLFISQLKTWELSAPSRETIQRSLKTHRAPLGDDFLAALGRLEAPSKLLQAALSHFAKLPWALPRKQDVIALDEESQFGAWVLVNGYDVIHFTGSVADIEKTVSAMEAAGIPMKAGIEGARGSRLRQSATEAVTREVAVLDGGKKTTMPWTYAYFEIAERRAGFEGFLGGQAAQLFEMTKVKPFV